MENELFARTVIPCLNENEQMEAYVNLAAEDMATSWAIDYIDSHLKECWETQKRFMQIIDHIYKKKSFVFQSLGEFFEILLVEEDLVLVVAESAVLFLTALAFSDGQVIVVVPLRGFHIEEIGTLSCTDRLRIDILRISLLGTAPLVIFTVHDLSFNSICLQM